ncbi:HEPN domain-containing protein [bacterium]
MIKQYEKWLLKASDDLQFAKLGLENSFYSQVCFLSQQCVEKSIKALIISEEKLYPKTHKIVDLFNQSKHAKNLLKNFKNKIKILDEFYIPTRYPDSIPGNYKDSLATEKDANEVFEIASQIYSTVYNFLTY